MATNPNAQIGRNVAAEMRRRGVTQTALAQVLATSQTAVSARLTGKTPFKIDELVRVAAHLDIPLGDLLATEAVAS